MQPDDPDAIERLATAGVRLRRAKSGRVLVADASPVADQIAAEQLEDLAGCPKLRELNLAHCPVGDSIATTLTQLTQLKSLDLQQTQVSNAIFPTLQQLELLQLVDLTGTAVTPETVRDYRKRLIRTRIVFLS